ncbi:MAG TPA: hypothetical protein VMT46_07575 [Anaerolineaceae bacterium]|nr:hypothetical protein [Anaerolineaceae bacterium]
MDRELTDLNQVVIDLNQKIDLLTSQVAYLTEQAQIAERSRRSGEELVDTLMPVAKDAMRLASSEFEEIQDYLQVEDLLRLVKKLARHRPQLEALLDQMDAISDLMQIMDPILKQGMDKLVSVLTELEEKGYFAFGQGGLRILDTIVSSFTKEDVDRLGDNIVLILNTVKDMTQPEIMNFVRSTLLVAEEEIEKPVEISYLALLKQMRDPAVRRGLALTLRVLNVVGSQAKT